MRGGPLSNIVCLSVTARVEGDRFEDRVQSRGSSCRGGRRRVSQLRGSPTPGSTKVSENSPTASRVDRRSTTEARPHLVPQLNTWGTSSSPARQRQEDRPCPSRPRVEISDVRAPGCGNGLVLACHVPRCLPGQGQERISNVPQSTNMTQTIEQQAEALARLRVLVSVLGGAAHANWWRTQFLTAAGLRFLDRLYPRTSYAAAVRATGVAATELHDSNIGRGGVYHLFRLPEPLEGQLQDLAGRGFFDQVLRDLESLLENREALLAQFDGLAAELPETEPGPQRIGSLRDLRCGNLLGRWAGAYLHAFRREYSVFPYVEAETTF